MCWSYCSSIMRSEVLISVDFWYPSRPQYQDAWNSKWKMAVQGGLIGHQSSDMKPTGNLNLKCTWHDFKQIILDLNIFSAWWEVMEINVMTVHMPFETIPETKLWNFIKTAEDTEALASHWSKARTKLQHSGQTKPESISESDGVEQIWPGHRSYHYAN